MMDQFLILMQGPPGGGKSTLACDLSTRYNAIIVSTDDLFTGPDGVYRFDGAKLPEYHRRTQELARNELAGGWNVIVDNTNLQQWQADPYIRMAREYGATVHVYRCNGVYPNKHGVPDDRVEKMRRDMRELTGVDATFIHDLKKETHHEKVE